MMILSLFTNFLFYYFPVPDECSYDELAEKPVNLSFLIFLQMSIFLWVYFYIFLQIFLFLKGQWAGPFPHDDELVLFQTSKGKSQPIILIVNLSFYFPFFQMSLPLSRWVGSLPTSWLRGWPTIFSMFIFS